MNKKMSYSQKDKNINDELYTYFLTHEAHDGWDDRDKYDNFHDLILLSQHAQYPLKSASVFDVGCGTGDMSAFLRKRGIREYTGIDIFEAGIQEARRKYPHETFLIGDFLDHEFTTTFDFVFCSGALTTKLHSDNYEVLTYWLEKMWHLAIHGVAFNFLAEEKPGQYEEDLFLYNIKRVFSICEDVAPNAKIAKKITRTGEKREYLQVHVYLYR